MTNEEVENFSILTLSAEVRQELGFLNKRNARLAASTIDLLRAAEDVLQECTLKPRYSPRDAAEAEHRLKAAIAKAKGV